MKIQLLKQKRSICASQTRSACTHSNKEMETSNNGADRSAQSNSQTKEWILLYIYTVYQGRIIMHSL